MTSKVLYKLDNSGNELFVLDTKNYTYNTSSNWRDQLVNDSQYSISYNNYGYPYTYLNQSIGYDDFNNITSIGSNTYTYNNAGIRLTKIENGYKHLYYYDGSRLIKEEVLNASNDTLIRTLVFIYNNDEVIGFKLDGVLYYYIKNLTGDIIFIYRSDNLKVAEYSYNAFGQVSIQYNIDSIASINPFRFKSYYYDTETGLYYLISRYYSPILMRFLTPDSIKYVNPDVINGVNLYMYCGYNPIMYSDPEGQMPEWAYWLISGVEIVGGTILCAIGVGGPIGGALISAGVNSLINGYASSKKGESFASGYIGGSITGILCGLGAGLGGSSFLAATDATGLVSVGYAALGITEAFSGAFVGNVLGSVYTNLHNNKFENINLDLNALIEKSLVMGMLNVLSIFGSGISSASGKMAKYSLDLASKNALSFLASVSAGLTEVTADFILYLIDLFNRY